MTVIDMPGDHPSVAEAMRTFLRTTLTMADFLDKASDSPIVQWYLNHVSHEVMIDAVYDNLTSVALGIYGNPWTNLAAWRVCFEFEDPSVAMLFKLTWM